MFLWEDVVVASQVRRRFHIPMYLLAGFFNYEKLMPSMLCSGLRIQIDFAPIKEALVMSRGSSSINPSLTYEITNLHIDAKSIQLTDSTQRLLNEMSASMGLDLVYTDINTTYSNLPSGGGDFHVEVRQACSRALRAWARIRDDNASATYLRDSYAADHWLVTYYQWRLGSLYFPQQPVKAYNPETLEKPILSDMLLAKWAGMTTNNRILYLNGLSQAGPELSNVAEAHLHALEMFGKVGGKNADSTVSLNQFKSGRIPFYSQSGGPFYGFLSLSDQLSRYQTEDELLATANPSHNEGTVNGQSTELAKKGWFNSDPIWTRTAKGRLTATNNRLQTSDYAQYYGNHSIIPCNLERSTLFNLSGVPINNSRILGLDLNVRYRVLGEIVTTAIPSAKVNYPTANSFSHKCDVFLQYIKLARVFMNNVEIEQ
jgi:hypothetical protein